MKKQVLVLLIFFFSVASSQQTNTPYDAELAKQLNADSYGMKTYVMAFLKKGPNRNHSAEEASELQQAHMQNIRKMADSGDLVIAGPFLENSEGLQGIYIFNVDSVEKARALTESDPAVKAGRLTMDLYQWYGSAALMLVNENHKKIAHNNP